MAVLHHFTDDNFQAEVLNSPAPVLVDFTAAWCAPCHMLAPVVARLNDGWNGLVKVGHLDIDANERITQAYEVLGVPTLILFKSGQPVARLTGYMTDKRILTKLEPHLA